MFSFFKKEKFEPEFPVIDLDSTPDEVFSKLSAFSSVDRTEDSDEKDIDYSFVVEKGVTRIHVGFANDRISYVNYLTEQFNGSEKKKAEKLNWFLEYYGSKEEYGEPNNTGYMIFFTTPKGISQSYTGYTWGLFVLTITQMPNKKLHADTHCYARFCVCRAAPFYTKTLSAICAGELGVMHKHTEK